MNAPDRQLHQWRENRRTKTATTFLCFTSVSRPAPLFCIASLLASLVRPPASRSSRPGVHHLSSTALDSFKRTSPKASPPFGAHSRLGYRRLALQACFAQAVIRFSQLFSRLIQYSPSVAFPRCWPPASNRRRFGAISLAPSDPTEKPDKRALQKCIFVLQNRCRAQPHQGDPGAKVASFRRRLF